MIPPTPEERQPWQPAPGGEDDAYPLDTLPIANRLQRDGASWRRHLPPSEGLREQVRSLTGISTREEHTMSEPSDSAPTQPISTPRPRLTASTSPRLPRTPRPRSGRDIVAGATALIVVVLFVALFGALAARGRGGPASSVNPTTTTTAADATTPAATASPTQASGVATGSLTHVAGLDGTSEPVLAPSDPTTAYVIVKNKSIARISSGAISTLPLPSLLTQHGYTWLDLTVSPLDSNTLYATASLLGADGNYLNPCPVQQPTALATGGNMLASPAGGSIPCMVQFVSSAGGQSWQMLQLPQHTFLGNASAAGAFAAYSQPPTVVGKEQLFDIADAGPLAAGGAQLLVTSTDRGVTWHQVSAPFSGAVCSITSPTGTSTVYVVVTTLGCISGYPQTVALWRSTNAGAAWVQVSLPSQVYPEAIAASSGGTQLYVLDGEYQAHTTPLTTPRDIYMSTNGGATWTRAPSAGVPTGANWVGTANEGVEPQPIVLQSGALLIPFAVGGSQTLSFYAWTPGTQAWRKVANLPIAASSSTPVLTDMLTLSPSGQEVVYFVLMTYDVNKGPSYGVYSLAI